MNTYGEGERVFGPPQGTYDAAWVAAAARQADPGLDPELALRLATEAWALLREIGEPDANELARRLLSNHAAQGATAASVVARAACDVVTAYDVPLA